MIIITEKFPVLDQQIEIENTYNIKNYTKFRTEAGGTGGIPLQQGVKKLKDANNM
jgi:hypothetical protein